MIGGEVPQIVLGLFRADAVCAGFGVRLMLQFFVDYGGCFPS